MDKEKRPRRAVNFAVADSGGFADIPHQTANVCAADLEAVSALRDSAESLPFTVLDFPERAFKDVFPFITGVTNAGRYVAGAFVVEVNRAPRIGSGKCGQPIAVAVGGIPIAMPVNHELNHQIILIKL